MKLIVEQESGIPPSFVNPIEILYSNEAPEAQVICTIAGHPKPTVKWLKDNEPIEESESTRFCYDEVTGHVSVQLKAVSTSDHNNILNYSIEAENEYGRAVGTAQIVFHAAVREMSPQHMNRAPRITPLSPQTVAQGSTLTFTSSFEGLPMPDIKWCRNGKDIIANEEITIVTQENKSTITVRNMVRQKAGKYEIFAINAAGESRESATVTISSDEPDENLLAPRFIMPLHPKAVLIDQVLILETKVESNPPSSFQWFFNAAPLQVTQTTRINSKENHSVLIIESVAYEASGMITCRAENVLGSVTSTATIKVVENANQLEETNEYISPRFIEKLKPVQLMDGETLRLFCRVIGYPTPKIQWMHNKQILEEIKGIELWQDGAGSCALTISEVFPEDEGEYACYATNKFGKAKSKTNVIVEGILGFTDLNVSHAQYRPQQQSNTLHTLYLVY